MTAITAYVVEEFRSAYRRDLAERPYLARDLVGRLAWTHAGEQLAYRIAHREAWNTWDIAGRGERAAALDLFRRIEELRQVRCARALDRRELAEASA